MRNASLLLRDLLFCAWITLAAVAFWAPYAGLSLPANVLTALYAVFLVAVVVTAALRWVRGREEPRPQPAERTEGSSRRGR